MFMYKTKYLDAIFPKNEPSLQDLRDLDETLYQEMIERQQSSRQRVQEIRMRLMLRDRIAREIRMERERNDEKKRRGSE